MSTPTRRPRVAPVKITERRPTRRIRRPEAEPVAYVRIPAHGWRPA